MDDSTAYGVSIACAALLGSTLTYTWFKEQLTEVQRRSYSKGLVIATIGFGLFLFVMWLLPESIRKWELILIPFIPPGLRWIGKLIAKKDAN